jgi:O-antigen ligase
MEIFTDRIKSKPKWHYYIIVLISVKPVVDFFYDMNLAAGVSILQIVSGVLFLMMLFAPRISAEGSLSTKGLMSLRILTVFFTFNAVVIVVNYPSVSMVGAIMKGLNILPVMLFFDKYLTSTDDLVDYLRVVLYSYVPMSVLLVYGVFINPLNVVTARGAERISGGYADVASVGMAVVVVTILMMFFEMHSRERGMKRFIPYWGWVVVILYVTLLLSKISHAATSMIFIAVLFYGVASLRKSGGAVIFVLMLFLLGAIYFSGSEVIEDSAHTMYGRELEVMAGERSDIQFMHGRLGRWQMLSEMYAESGVLNIIAGVEVYKWPALFIHAAHNDYLRILFSSGAAGLVLYLMFIFRTIGLSIRLRSDSFRYLSNSVLILVVLLSITLTPTTYHAVLFVFIPVAIWLRKEKAYAKQKLTSS